MAQKLVFVLYSTGLGVKALGIGWSVISPSMQGLEVGFGENENIFPGLHFIKVHMCMWAWDAVCEKEKKKTITKDRNYWCGKLLLLVWSFGIVLDHSRPFPIL